MDTIFLGKSLIFLQNRTLCFQRQIHKKNYFLSQMPLSTLRFHHHKGHATLQDKDHMEFSLNSSCHPANNCHIRYRKLSDSLPSLSMTCLKYSFCRQKSLPQLLTQKSMMTQGTDLSYPIGKGDPKRPRRQELHLLRRGCDPSSCLHR